MANNAEQGHEQSIILTSLEGGFDAVHSLLDNLWIEAPYVETLDRIGFETALIELVSNVFQHGDSEMNPICTITVTTYSDRIDVLKTDLAVLLKGRLFSSNTVLISLAKLRVS